MSRVLQFFIEETGVVKDFAGSTAPAGYLMCFGQAVSRVTYKKLFDVIGVAFGPGDGSTTFNVPDCRGRAAVGKDDMGGTAAGRMTTAGGGINGAQLGATGGSQAHTLTASQIPAHAHGLYGSSSGSSSNAVGLVSSNATGIGGMFGGAATPDYQTNFTSGSAQQIMQDTGGGQAHPSVQPGIVFNKIIKT